MKSAREVVAVGGKTRDELAFLPAALEIVETPPSPTARLTAVLLAALFCCAVAWAGLGKIDIVASAPGKIVPGDRVKLDRKSTRLNSSHMSISYAVFCLKKKK